MDSPQTNIVDRDVLGIFVANAATSPATLVSFKGTGFLIADELLITCWHCVSESLPDGQRYCVAYKEQGPKNFQIAYLNDVSQAQTRADLATARVSLKQHFDLSLAREDAEMGVDVWGFGYPLTDIKRGPNGGQQFQLNARYIQGYVMRAFYFEHHAYGRIPSYELDMPAPAGLSGAPVIRVRSREVIGVIYGNNDVATIEELVHIDPATGERQPEIHRILSFCLAHHTENLRQLSGIATGGKPLLQYLGLHGGA